MAAYKPGFLIVRSFYSLYARFSEPADAPIYSIPVAGVDAEAVAKKYRGIDREALEAWSAKDLELGFPNKPLPKQEERAACLALFDLQERGAAGDDFIAGVEDARSEYSLPENAEEWELVWAAPSNSDAPRPPEASYLVLSRRGSVAITFPLCATACVSHVGMEPMRRGRFFRRISDG
jgi:hypothetical protein